MSKKKTPAAKLAAYRFDKKIQQVEKLLRELRRSVNAHAKATRAAAPALSPELRREILGHIAENPGCPLMRLQAAFHSHCPGDTWAAMRAITVAMQREGLIKIKVDGRRRFRRHYITQAGEAIR